VELTINEAALIPLAPGNAVDRGWPAATDGRPHGVTWHWTATRTLEHCRRLLGGAHPERRGEASAHYAVGRSFEEGVDRYVSLDDRAWHAGVGQSLRWDGGPLRGGDDRGSRTTIGVETVNIGQARRGVPAEPDWIACAAPNCRQELRVQPWTDEQYAMLIDVGREIVARWPLIRPEHHHGHHDLCPAYKLDVSGFDFARLLRGIYDDPTIPDVWTPFRTVRQRQRALVALGYRFGGVDGDWGRRSDGALRLFQAEHGLVEDGLWTGFTGRAVDAALRERGVEAGDATDRAASQAS
jgi:N-acetyl-anhydromuramyl-L-alanine amidase AmpD